MLVVWGCKIGDLVGCYNLTWYTPPTSLQVLDFSSMGGSHQETRVIFLDEFRISVFPGTSGIMEFLVPDKLIPQDHPGSLRRLGVPELFHSWIARVPSDRDWLLGTSNADNPLIADLAQAVLVVGVVGSWEPLVSPVARRMLRLNGRVSHRQTPVYRGTNRGEMPWLSRSQHVIASQTLLFMVPSR